MPEHHISVSFSFPECVTTELKTSNQISHRLHVDTYPTNLVPVRTSRLWFFLLPGTFYKLNYRRVSGKKYSFALLCVELPPTYSFELLDTFISLSLITMRKE